MSHTQRGFTLVELLVVIVILSVLVAILLPALSRARHSAMQASLKRDYMIQSVAGQGGPQAAPPAAPARPLALIHNFAADITLTPRLSVGTDQPESIYEAKFAAKMQASRSSKDSAESEIQLPLPPQIISLGDLAINVNGQPSDTVSLREGKLLWQGTMPADAPSNFDVTYTALGKGLYALEAPPSKILDRFQIKLTANGSDVRMLELSMQPTDLARESGRTIYNWDYKRLMFGRPIALDVLGIAPIDRLGELSWLGPLSVITFGLVLGLFTRAFKLDRFDRWMLLLVLGTFTGAFPLMYFAQEFIPLSYAMFAAGIIVLVIIGLRVVSIMGWRLAFAGVVFPAAITMTLTLAAALHTNLQGIILTGMSLGLFIVAMLLAPRLQFHRDVFPAPALA